MSVFWKVLNVAVGGGEEWSGFFAQGRALLERVHVLAGATSIHLTVGISQHLSHTGKLIRIHTDRNAFDDAIVAASLKAW